MRDIVRRTLVLGLAALLGAAPVGAATLNPQPEPPGRARVAAPAERKAQAENVVKLLFKGEHDHDARALLEAARILGANHAYVSEKPHGSNEPAVKRGPLALLKLALGYAGADAQLSAEIGHEMTIQHPTVSMIHCECFFYTQCDSSGHCTDYEFCYCYDGPE
jgi:hypothetical protein